MHLELTQARELFAGIVDEAQGYPEDVQILVLPPFPFLQPLYRELPSEAPIELGAQNCHQKEEGAFTGEVSPPMLSSVGAKHCIVGHSERRQHFAEDDECVLAKARSLLANSIAPIICVGETLEERNEGKAAERIDEQLSRSLLQLSPTEANSCVIAYEPIWAIGTGHTATPEQAQEMHGRIRERIADEWGEKEAERIPILYGGSCKSKNAASLFEQKDIDGGLIGGASLKADEFASIIRSFP